jgi:hypothetical protein
LSTHVPFKCNVYRYAAVHSAATAAAPVVAAGIGGETSFAGTATGGGWSAWKRPPLAQCTPEAGLTF